MQSLSARLLVSVSVLLILFFGLTIAVLDYAFRSAGEQAAENILDGNLMQLLAAAEPDDNGGLSMPSILPEPRFSAIGSGLYALLRTDTEGVIWQSESSLGLDLPEGATPPPGQQVFARQNLQDGTPVLGLTLAVEWEFNDGSLERYIFTVLESLESFNAQNSEFRRQLFTWFGALALIMLLALGSLLRRTLRPLRNIEREIGEIERGVRTGLSQQQPTELAGVARNMNALIESERARSDRYRKTLDNLAHSLKTPLAAMRSLFGDAEMDPQQRSRVNEQIDRMDEIVRYQLRKRTSVTSDTLGTTAIDIKAEVARLVDGLQKVHRDKQLHFVVEVEDGLQFRGEPGDFLELTGNLLDNACKWGAHSVRLAISRHASRKNQLHITVEDDGPGIDDAAIESLAMRGKRFDEAMPGHGIGLAIVKDIAESYSGSLNVSRSALGGARFDVDIRSA
jgi:two-component system sensor histidine kinase PhoQ